MLIKANLSKTSSAGKNPFLNIHFCQLIKFWSHSGEQTNHLPKICLTWDTALFTGMTISVFLHDCLYNFICQCPANVPRLAQAASSAPDTQPTIPALFSSMFLILYLILKDQDMIWFTWVFRRRPRSLNQSWIWPLYQGEGSAGSCDSPLGTGPPTGVMRSWRILSIKNHEICPLSPQIVSTWYFGILTLWSSDYTEVFKPKSYLSCTQCKRQKSLANRNQYFGYYLVLLGIIWLLLDLDLD